MTPFSDRFPRSTHAGRCILVGSIAVLLSVPTGPLALDAQLPPEAEQAALRLLQQDPGAVRDRLLQSGLSLAEVRARLSSAGLPAATLDQFFSSDPLGAGAATDGQVVDALQALGIAESTPDGLVLVPLTVGMQAPSNRSNANAGYPIFGMDVFARATSQFQPLLSGPAPPNYRIGPGDQMVLLITGEIERAHELSVTREGSVFVPQVGQLAVANLTMEAFRVLLRQRLAASFSGIDRGTTSFDVTVSRLRTNQIYVLGEVEQAGAYQLSSVATLLNALYAAGGPTELGSLRNIRLRRRSGGELTLDLYPYLLEGDNSGDVILEQGDAVFVPLRGRRVQLLGSVVRPAHYELSDEDDLMDVLLAGGGFAPSARRQRITIHRVLRPGDRGPGLSDRAAIDLGLETATDTAAPTYLGGVSIPPVGLQDGDSIVVDELPDLLGGYYVTIDGRVQAPGQFAWRQGMTLRDLTELARGPVVGADLREAEVSRLPEDRVEGQLATLHRVPLDSSYLSQRDSAGRFAGPPGVAFLPPGSSPEFELQPYDEVVILRQPDFEMQRSVFITGEVPVPGRYALETKSDRLSDLVGRAGGLLNTAYPEGARLYRAEEDLGRINIELPNALANPRELDDVTLEPGDSLHIPVYSPTVEVRGAVNSPVTVLYQAGQGFGYYIENAGGYRNDADKGRASVRYANGQAELRNKFLFWSSYPDPGPGSTISVPAQDPADRFDTRALITDLVGILGSLTTVIVVLTR